MRIIDQSVYMKEKHRTSMKEDKYNLTLARSPNICSHGKAAMHYECIVEPLSVDKHWVLQKDVFVANLYSRQE